MNTVRSPKGIYVTFTVCNSRDNRGYLTDSSKTFIYFNETDFKLGKEPVLILENRLPLFPNSWLIIDDTEYLVTTTGQSCVVGYSDGDERYESVIINCTNFSKTYTSLTYWDTKVMLGMSNTYDGYDSNLSVVDLYSMKKIEFESFTYSSDKPYVEYNRPYINFHKDRCVYNEDFKFSFFDSNGERGIVVLLLQYYRILNGFAFIEDETTFEDDKDVDKYDPLAIYSSTNDNYLFKSAQVGHIIFTIQDGTLKLKDKFFMTPKTMSQAEFESLYRYENENNAWLSSDNMQIYKYFP